MLLSSTTFALPQGAAICSFNGEKPFLSFDHDDVEQSIDFLRHIVDLSQFKSAHGTAQSASFHANITTVGRMGSGKLYTNWFKVGEPLTITISGGGTKILGFLVAVTHPGQDVGIPDGGGYTEWTTTPGETKKCTNNGQQHAVTHSKQLDTSSRTLTYTVPPSAATDKHIIVQAIVVCPGGPGAPQCWKKIEVKVYNIAFWKQDS
ncbi:hypothetical protein SeLEV6574_g08659 [Synchytrium endobioticum]|uniref:Reelin domain-containing protein n=1 Tax=Synchytrium endobioticum TaxID=286115 RepID=A0A507BVT4_9FUNG|nr:hypothetical protein SeLEV6574_g08659 [Synchytrium endobioticum]